MENLIMDEVSARDFVRVLFKRKGTIFFIVFVTLFIVALYSYFVLPTYEATAQLLYVAQKSAPMP